MNDLQRYFERNPGRLIHKWQHYFEIYDRHFSRFKGTDVHVVEFGVAHGGSLQMWKHYFGPRARIWGVDINPHCKDVEEDRIEILIGSQEDRDFLRSLRHEIPRVDILIDDGGHTMRQQIATFEELFSHVDANGIYLCEDLHTSYWPDWGGGHGKQNTFIERSKRLIDHLHHWHSLQPTRFPPSDYTRSIHGLHFYDSVLVIEKRPIDKPVHVQTGVGTVRKFRRPESAWQRTRTRVRDSVRHWTGKLKGAD
jgi:hypothetical protein